jgi:hypothetical protein
MMFRRIILATTVAIPLGLSGLAWADPDYNPPFVFQYGRAHPVTPQLSCDAARKLVRAEGYRHVAQASCGANTYAFHALRNGRAVTVHVNPRNGKLSP